MSGRANRSAGECIPGFRTRAKNSFAALAWLGPACALALLVSGCSRPAVPDQPPGRLPSAPALPARPASPAAQAPSAPALATGTAPPPDAPSTLAPVTEADKLYVSRCVLCHGSGGRGDGPVAAAMAVPPGDFTSAAWQASFTDEQIETAILRGSRAIGRSSSMDGNPDLAELPDMVVGLRQKVRSLATGLSGH
jgi:mono/diheme cytochrome c family protein